MLAKTVRRTSITGTTNILTSLAVRVAAKELTALILDEERLRAERTDRKTWKSRVSGIEEFAPEQVAGPSRQRPRRQPSDVDEDLEYRLAIEASKNQEEEDRRKRASRQGPGEDDDDLAKAIKLSQEEEERRRRELEESNASSLFDNDPAPSNPPQFTGMNMGYQQGSNVDWLGNPIDQNQQMQTQPTGYVNNSYTGYPSNGYTNGFAQPQPTGIYNNNPYGQQTLQPQQQSFQMQPTGYNPYAQQQQQQQQFVPQPTASPEPPAPQPGSNNPWASNNSQPQSQSPLQPLKTGSNNPFASGFGRPQTANAPPMPSLHNLQSLPEQKSLQTFTPPPMPSQPSFSQPPPQKQLSEHEQKLNALLASGDGMDTFGNTGELRIPAQHTAPGTFVNSAGAGSQRLTAEATGNNPFLRQQFTGMPAVSYGQQMPAATGPVGMNGYGGGSNPFASRPQQQQNNQQGQDLIQF